MRWIILIENKTEPILGKGRYVLDRAKINAVTITTLKTIVLTDEIT
jgi:hypothetical protein